MGKIAEFLHSDETNQIEKKNDAEEKRKNGWSNIHELTRGYGNWFTCGRLPLDKNMELSQGIKKEGRAHGHIFMCWLLPIPSIFSGKQEASYWLKREDRKDTLEI